MKLTAWTYGIDMDAIWSTVQGDGLCEVADGACGSAVTRAVLLAGQTKDAGRVDDPSTISVGVRFLSHHLC